MAIESTFSYLDLFLPQQAHLVEALYADAKAARWGLSRQDFNAGLRRSAEKRFGNGRCDISEVHAYLKSLRLEDLALACACSQGIEMAWEFFVVNFRQDLRVASRAILRASGSGNDPRAEELAGSLYAELYGVRSAGNGRRKSLFEYFHGRSKLSTWLRAVLAQRHVDLLRTDRVTISIDASRLPARQGTDVNEDAPLIGPSADSKLNLRTFSPVADAAPADPHRARFLAQLDRALSLALIRLAPRERMLLACYYVDQLTLAEIGRTMNEHESTVSRQLERARCALKETVTEILQNGTPAQDGRPADQALDAAQIELAFEYAVEDWGFDLSEALLKAEAAADARDK